MSGTIPNEFQNSEENDEEEDDEDEDSRPRENEESTEDEVRSGSIMTRSTYGGLSNAPSNSVRVAVRIRPLLPREVIANARECITVTPGEPQVFMGSHAYTYDFVFQPDAAQDEIFEKCAKPLVDGILEGYNATILAYGQTGSGKTYTMGTGFDPEVTNSATLVTTPTNLGILPRCISYLFDQIRELTVQISPAPDFKVSVQFTELYNEEVIDLLSDNPIMHSSTSRPATGNKSNIKIHEDSSGQIYLVNLATKSVSSCSETLETLKTGALNRTTASTNMNDSSSRSHAIFSIMVNQTRVVVDKSGASDIESLHAKFHFVDLAGSERLKRTLATGDRAKEGIAINSGLLVLGNVISALGDKSKKATHVPYRDSKLTRLLQDSLGGNSRTLMIACVSPNEMDFVESINTMKYANRAKNIKNKVVINQDKSSRTIALLKDRINELESELMEYKRGSRKPEHELELDVNAENIMLLAEVETLKSKLKSKQDTIDKLLSQIARLQAVTITDDPSCDLTNLVSKYLHEIEDLRAKLYESESECEKLRSKQRQIIKNLASPRESGTGNVSMSVSINEDVTCLLTKAKEEVSEQKHVVEVKRKVVKSEDEESSEDEDDSSSSERDGNTNNYTELASLNQEISTKQRLIEELENSQLRMESMKNKYEEKLGQLINKIRSTEEERDAVMKKKTGSAAKEKNQEYEIKIREYQAELKRWNSAKKEHAKLIRDQSCYEAQIDKYKREIEEMKKMKVKLIHQVKNENLRHREVEKQRAKEITQLKKETRKQEFKVRKLESDSKLKDAVLKRKLQEVEMLKKNRFNSKVKTSSPVKGKQAWSRIQNSMKKEANSRCSVASLEKDMVGLIQRRSELNGMLSNETDIDNLDSIQSNLALVEDKIKAIQEEIVCSNDRGEEKDSTRRSVVVEHLSNLDYSYVVEKLFEQNVESMSCVGMLEGRVHETEEVNKHLQREVETLRDLLHHLYMRKSSSEAENEQQRRIEHMLMPPPALPGMSAPPPPPPSSAPKARRRLTATTQELLGSVESLEMLCDQQPPTNIPINNRFTRNTRLTQSMRSASAGGSSQTTRNKTKPALTRQDTYSVIDSNVLNNTYVIEGTNDADTNITNKTALQRSVSEISDVERTTRSIRGPGNVRSPRGNAWLNLSSFLEGHSKPVLCLSSTNELVVSGSKDATCRVWDLETSKEVGCYEGHPHNVSCVCHVPESNLIMTGSSYQIKIFDTRTNEPVKSFSSSGGEWIGPLQSQPPIPSLHSATLPRVNDLPSGEKQVHSIQAVRNYFFTSFGERIRIWDIRKLQPLGTLYGKHNSSVMCITGCESGLHGKDWMITGSKDHSIKVYEYNPNTPPDQINCVKNLNPPHYDGIECLLLGNKRNGTLYSGSRDMCIKKWDLENSKIVGTVNMAHSGWITGLANVPSSQTDHEYVISSSRDGSLKIWDSSREFKEIARFENNLGLECVNTNDKYVFFGGTGTGNNAIGNSVDGVIGVFKLSETWSKNLFCNNNNVLPSNVTTRAGSGGNSNNRQTQYLAENI
ncbi:unnamed protein product [Orchesella dallaii]|uniref:Kinesin motor domain-containing protein n=1 Tax=Orchesella dallaii TaxID=48710 RepID=A0ABP1QM68_9HEXA